ncbi:hypothetical protein PS2_000407 [Malus domestica]
MAELQGQKETNRDFETTIEAAEKRIKLLLRPGEMKAHFKQFKKEAESKLPPLPLKEPLIRVRRNLHPLFLGESLEYMKEFHKKYFANDLYGLPKHIREAKVLGFEADPYTDIDTAELPFSLKDLQHLRYHFEVFSAISLFGLTVDETERVARLDAYLDTRNARIAYEERARKIRQEQSPTPYACKPEDDSQQDTTSDCMVDVVTEEATQVDFVTTTEDESPDDDDKLKTALDILFPRSTSTNLQHSKPLYVTAHIEGYLISKIFIDC